MFIIGAGCSVRSQPVAHSAPFWNMIQVQYIQCVSLCTLQGGLYCAFTSLNFIFDFFLVVLLIVLP